MRAAPHTPTTFDRPSLLDFDEAFPSLAFLGLRHGGWRDRLRATFEEARAFCQTHVRPLALSSDLALQRDPERTADELLELAIEHRRFSRLVPRMLGGLGDASVITPMITAEEMSAVDPGFVGVLSGHGLGMVALGLSMNLRLLDLFARKTVACEAGGPRFLIDCAITEPSAGTDLEEVELMPHANLASEAKRVPGGAILNGRKCFISGGHFATHHLVIMPFDRRDPVGTAGMFLVAGDTPGFSLGKLENKMGQKSGPASELVFDDCFVPDDMVVIDAEAMGSGIARMLLDGVMGATRIYVGAWATGAARGAFEIALQFAQAHEYRGKALIAHQWAQQALTNMLMNVHVARATYLQAIFALMHANGLTEVPGWVNSSWFGQLCRFHPIRKLWQSRAAQRLLVRKQIAREGSSSDRVQFYSSLAKVTCSDLAMENCHLAIDLMGAIGLRHSAGAEKLFRDAKLFQIFEGTNQMNRLHMFKHFVGRDMPALDIY